LEESIRATEQQKQAAEQVAAAMVQIRAAAEQLAAEGRQRAEAAEVVTTLVGRLERGLERRGPGAMTQNGTGPGGGGEVPLDERFAGSPHAAANDAPADVVRQL
jgi:hypothetical protein